MTPQVTEIVMILKELLRFYDKALALGASIPTLDPEGIQAVLEERERIWGFTAKYCTRVKQLEATLETMHVPPSEIGFMNEQKACVKDYSPRFMEQDRRVSAALRMRRGVLRSKMADHNKTANAIRSYLTAPRAKPFV